MLKNNEEQIAINHELLLIQKKDGLKFGTDALLLSAFIGMHGAKAHAIELGSGTGIISLLCLKREQFGCVTALEVQAEYAELTARNAELNQLSHRICAVHTDIRDYRQSEEADVVFTNPPYMKVDSGKQNEKREKFLARHEACGTIDDFCRCGAKMLKYGGYFYAVYRPDRLVDLLCAMRQASLEPKRMRYVAQSPLHTPSLVLIEAKKGASAGCQILPCLFFRNADGSENLTTAEWIEKGMIYGI